MKHLTIREARQALSHLDRILEAEGEITITKRGKAVARITRLDKKVPMPSHRNLRQKMPVVSRGSEELTREDRNAR
jgi:antitoxin (DNA-binding transcriptional repressor) of toxin-antitoxin stability system